MAPTETPAPEALDTSALDDALALSEEAGWNQVAADWLYFLEHGTVFGVRDAAGRLVGSAAILPYGDSFAWISMVLVSTSYRGQGLGTRLLQHCLAALDRIGRTAVLDATPAGEPVYRPLGFAGSLRATRWQGLGGAPADSAAAAAAFDLPAAVALDAAAFGALRHGLLESFAQRLPSAAAVSTCGRAMILGRDGRVAHQVGPLAASDEAAAVELLDQVLDRLSGPVFLDVLDERAALVERLKARGFVPQRPFLRMARGQPEPLGDPNRLFVIAGPEFG